MTSALHLLPFGAIGHLAAGRAQMGTSLGPLAFQANELGWLVSEFGRQPWVVYGVFRTSSAITTASGLGATFTGFMLLYLGPQRGHDLGRAPGVHRKPRPRGETTPQPGLR